MCSVTEKEIGLLVERLGGVFRGGVGELVGLPERVGGHACLFIVTLYKEQFFDLVVAFQQGDDFVHKGEKNLVGLYVLVACADQGDQDRLHGNVGIRGEVKHVKVGPDAADDAAFADFAAAECDAADVGEEAAG